MADRGRINLTAARLVDPLASRVLGSFGVAHVYAWRGEEWVWIIHEREEWMPSL